MSKNLDLTPGEGITAPATTDAAEAAAPAGTLDLAPATLTGEVDFAGAEVVTLGTGAITVDAPAAEAEAAPVAAAAPAGELVFNAAAAAPGALAIVGHNTFDAEIVGAGGRAVIVAPLTEVRLDADRTTLGGAIYAHQVNIGGGILGGNGSAVSIVPTPVDAVTEEGHMAVSEISSGGHTLVAPEGQVLVISVTHAAPAEAAPAEAAPAEAAPAAEAEAAAELSGASDDHADSL